MYHTYAHTYIHIMRELVQGRGPCDYGGWQAWNEASQKLGVLGKSWGRISPLGNFNSWPGEVRAVAASPAPSASHQVPPVPSKAEAGENGPASWVGKLGSKRWWPAGGPLALRLWAECVLGGANWPEPLCWKLNPRGGDRRWAFGRWLGLGHGILRNGV